MCTPVFLIHYHSPTLPLTLKFWKLFLVVIYVTIVFLMILIAGKPKRSINNNNLHSFINWLQVRSHDPTISIRHRINYKFSYIATTNNWKWLRIWVQKKNYTPRSGWDWLSRPAPYVSTLCYSVFRCIFLAPSFLLSFSFVMWIRCSFFLLCSYSISLYSIKLFFLSLFFFPSPGRNDDDHWFWRTGIAPPARASILSSSLLVFFLFLLLKLNYLRTQSGFFKCISWPSLTHILSV